MSLGRLHVIIQLAMGWCGGHMHQFEVGGTYFSNPTFGLDDVEDENKTCLAMIASTKGSSFDYEYDFGDGWIHKIKVEKIIEPTESISETHVACTGGKRNCPPEDCGGP